MHIKKELLAGFTTLFLIGATGLANALTITYDPDDILIDSNNKSIDHVFDITASPYLFHPGTFGDTGVDNLVSAQLEIWAYDGITDNSSEKYKIILDFYTSIVDETVVNKSIVSTMVSDVTVVTFLQPDGKLNVKVKRQAGNFWLDKEVLNFDIERYTPDTLASSPVPVPEPATMLLLGTGLVGLFALGRRKMN